MNVVARRATADDIPALVELRWLSSIEDGGDAQPRSDFERKMRAFLEGAIGDPRWRIWVAAEDGRVVATAYYQIVPKVPRPWPNEAWGYLTTVFTLPDRRDAGVGSRLLTAVRESARADGLELLLLWPSERSVPFYERLGFARDETLELGL